jgi:hypothetical protein
MQPMAKKTSLFAIHGAEELAKELKDMAQGFQNKMVRPGLTVAIAEVRKEVKRRIKAEKLVNTGIMEKTIKSKVFSDGRGQGLTARAGILDSTMVSNGESAVSVAKYASVQNYGTTKAGKGKNTVIKGKFFLPQSLLAAEPVATKKLLERVQQKVDDYHAKNGDKGNVSE